MYFLCDILIIVLRSQLGANGWGGTGTSRAHLISKQKVTVTQTLKNLFLLHLILCLRSEGLPVASRVRQWSDEASYYSRRDSGYALISAGFLKSCNTPWPRRKGSRLPPRNLDSWQSRPDSRNTHLPRRNLPRHEPGGSLLLACQESRPCRLPQEVRPLLRRNPRNVVGRLSREQPLELALTHEMRQNQHLHRRVELDHPSCRPLLQVPGLRVKTLNRFM